jgi:hypothetical protein
MIQKKDSDELDFLDKFTNMMTNLIIFRFLK